MTAGHPQQLPRTAYLVCLRGLVRGRDVAIRTAERQASWLSPGLRGWLSLQLWTGREALRARTAKVRAAAARPVYGRDRRQEDSREKWPALKRRAGRGRAPVINARAGAPKE